MLTDEKILVTGAAGHIAFPLVEYLAKDNDVWGIARFSGEGSREKVEAVGATTRVCDLSQADFSELPDDFTYVLHLAATIGPGLDYDSAIRTNGEGTGLLLQHCRSAKAALIMSTHSVYKPPEDHDHVFKETDPLGDVNALFAPTYSVSKIGEEIVARYCARAFDLPVIICRMNAAYASDHGLPLMFVDAVVNESLRLWPPGVAAGRQAVEPLDVGGFRIKAGTFVLYSPYVTHRLPGLWPDPLAFRPERWLRDAPGYAEPPSFAFLPFGAGPRACQQLVLGGKGLARGVVERKDRASGERDEVALGDVVAVVSTR